MLNLGGWGFKQSSESIQTVVLYHKVNQTQVKSPSVPDLSRHLLRRYLKFGHGLRFECALATAK